MKDQPLVVKIEDEELVLRIGINTLAFAADAQDAFVPYDEEKGDWVRKYKVTDPKEFASDIKRAMQDEREDGSSPLTDFLDKMTIAALDDGSIAIEECR